MTKGYRVAHVEVSDPDAHKGFSAADALAFGPCGARFLVRAWRAAMHQRHVVIEFRDDASALAGYES